MLSRGDCCAVGFLLGLALMFGGIILKSADTATRQPHAPWQDNVCLREPRTYGACSVFAHREDR